MVSHAIPLGQQSNSQYEKSPEHDY